MPIGMALVTCASVMPASETPALAKANSGSTPKRTHGPSASSSRSSVLSECPGAGGQRHGERGRDAGERCVHARFHDAHPDEDADQYVGPDRGDAPVVEQDQRGEPDAGQGERGKRQLRGIEERDDDDGAEVVDDGERQQEDLQRRRNARAEQRQHADGEGNVGGGGNGPAAQGDGVTPVDGDVDQRRHDHAAERGDHGQRSLLAPSTARRRPARA